MERNLIVKMEQFIINEINPCWMMPSRILYDAARSLASHDLHAIFYIKTSKSGPEAQLFLIKTTIMTLSRGVDHYIFALKLLDKTHLRFDNNNFEIRQ